MTVSCVDLTRLNTVSKSLMLDCGARALEHYRDVGEVISKSDNSPLTAADLEIDNRIYEVLHHEFPEIDIVTEERAATHFQRIAGKPFFLVDPIDGTREFINKRDEFTINIALIENAIPVFGAICVPARGELFLADIENGAFEISCDFDLNALGEPQGISPANPDNNHLRMAASRSHQDDQTKAFIAANPTDNLVTAGSSLKFCLLARGAADLYPRFGPTMEWDTAAGHAILLAAGGEVCDCAGDPMRYGKPQFRNHAFIASTPGVKYII